MVSFSEGQKIELDAVITRSHFTKSGYLYKITDGSYTFSLVSSSNHQIGEVLRVVGVVEDLSDFRIREEKSSAYSGDEELKVRKSIEQKVLKSIKIDELPLMLDCELTQHLKPKFHEVARALIASQKLGRYLLLRFHSDADGISGAFALTQFLRCNALQQNSAIYSEKDAIRDLSTMHHEYRPLVVLLDFGANKESEDGLKLLKAGGVEIVIIDHHPPIENINNYATIFLSPWAVSSDDSSSKYPAGYLACEVARVVGSTANLEELALISCAGDKSDILPVDENARDKALVLDYLAIYSAYGNNLNFYRSVFENSELFNSMLVQARDKIANIVKAVKPSMKQFDLNGVGVFVVELERAIKQNEFPSRGKIATYIFESLGNNSPVVVIGYGNRSVMMRINQLALDRGIAGDKLAVKIKDTMRDFVEAGGGHAKAAAIRVKEGFANSVIDALLKEIKSIPDS